MKIIAETERLILRTFTEDDAAMVFDLCKDPEVVKYTGEVPLESEKQALKILKEEILENQYAQSGFGRWAVHLKKNGIFIGWCGLRQKNDETDLGFRLRKRFWGKGFATEAARAAIETGFRDLGLDKIYARSMRENKASINVMEKAGMTFAGEKDFETHQGVEYVINKEDWEKQKSGKF